ncbi:MAG: hypothetical protein K6F69_00355 [Treponema sp.]|nr:hypothetical protein [Treponema sp.]
MKLNKSILTASLLTLVGTFSFAQTYTVNNDATKKISDGFSDFADSITMAAPQTATQQNVWSDAYIGSLFPGLKFGFGATVGVTQLDISGLATAVEGIKSSYNEYSSAFGGDRLSFKLPDSFVFPTVTLDARIGGVVLPFDVGFCAMMTSPSLAGLSFDDKEDVLEAGNISFSLDNADVDFSYITLGLDIRYALIEENLLLPGLSVGAGYIYSKGAFNASATSDNASSNASMVFSTNVAYLQAQVSKSFLVATVFGGGRAVFSDTETAWAWDLNASYESITMTSGDSGDTSSGFGNFQPQIYAGASLNFLVLQTSLSACADLRSLFDSSYESLLSAALSVHVKL